jgi:hypothetical protein
MSAFAFTFAVPMAKWMGLNGTMLGLIGSQLLFQGIVVVALLMKSNFIVSNAAISGHSRSAVK